MPETVIHATSCPAPSTDLAWPNSASALSAFAGVAASLTLELGSTVVVAVACLVPLLLAAHNSRVAKVFLFAWLAGTIDFAVLLWPAIVPFGVIGNSHFSHIAQLIIIASLEGAFIGAAVAAAFFVTRRVGFPLMLTLPVAWVAQEWARGVFPWGGFPWGFLGYAAIHDLRFIQVAEFTGVYGVSALIAMLGVAVYQLATEARSIRSAFRIALLLRRSAEQRVERLAGSRQA